MTGIKRKSRKDARRPGTEEGCILGGTEGGVGNEDLFLEKVQDLMKNTKGTGEVGEPFVGGTRVPCPWDRGKKNGSPFSGGDSSEREKGAKETQRKRRLTE